MQFRRGGRNYIMTTGLLWSFVWDVLKYRVSLDLFASTALDQVSSKTLEMSFPVGYPPQKHCQLRWCSCQRNIVLHTVYTVGAGQVPPVDRRGVDRVPAYDCFCSTNPETCAAVDLLALNAMGLFWSSHTSLLRYFGMFWSQARAPGLCALCQRASSRGC